MDFAQRELEKYGWTKGKGLGKTQNGITEALKPKVKLNKGGIGLDISKDHTDRWWERSFNAAASNIQTDTSVDQVTFTSSEKKNKKRKNDLYLGFIKKGTNITEDTDDTENSEPEEEISIPKLSDEELFKACGGRTSHKAARHGLNLSGKLARIQQQEEEALLALQNVNKTKRKSKGKDKDAKKIKL